MCFCTAADGDDVKSAVAAQTMDKTQTLCGLC